MMKLLRVFSGRNLLLMYLIVSILFSLTMVSVSVQAHTVPGPITYYVPPWYEHPFAPIFGFHDVNVDVWIDSPVGSGIVAVAVSLRWDPSVLTLGFYYPWAPTVLVEATEGDFLSSWATAYPWPYGTSFFRGSVDQTEGTARLFMIAINRLMSLPHGTGADGTGKLITFTPLNATAYSPLDLIDVDLQFFTHDAGFPVDVVEDGHYNALPATIDIDPDTLNLRSERQWITAYIQLPEAYNPEDIDANTILLNETIQPVLDPKYDFVTNSSEYLVDHNEDGILERMVKFDRAEVMALLSVGEATLTITGKMNGAPFEGTDTIKVLFPGDIDGDGDVDFTDFYLFSGVYPSDTALDPRVDIDNDGDVDFTDFWIFAGHYPTL